VIRLSLVQFAILTVLAGSGVVYIVVLILNALGVIHVRLS
jgi:hypothetical protein